jgi:hypothetical protein
MELLQKLDEKVEEVVLKQNVISSVLKKIESLENKIQNICDVVFEFEETQTKTFQKIGNIENFFNTLNEDKIHKEKNIEEIEKTENIESIEKTENIETVEEVKREVTINELPLEKDNISMEITKSDDENEPEIKPTIKLPNFKHILAEMEILQEDMTELVETGECDWIRTDEEPLEENDANELLEESNFVWKDKYTVKIKDDIIKYKIKESLQNNYECILLRDSFDTKNIVKVKFDGEENVLYNLWDKVVGKVNTWTYDDFETEEYELFEEAMDKGLINPTFPLTSKINIERVKEKLGKNNQQIKFKLYHYCKHEKDVVNTQKEVGILDIDLDFYFEDTTNN